MHLLKDTAIITPGAVTVASTGASSVAHSAGAVTVKCFLQPAASRESVQWHRTTGEVVYDLFIAPADTSGSSLSFASAAWKEGSAVIGGVTYRMVGEPYDVCGNGCLWRAAIARNS